MPDLTHTELTAEITAAYVARNAVQPAELPGLIRSVYTAIAGLGQAVPVKEAVPLKPAVPVNKSVTQDYIVCLEDGKRFKSLRRHLTASYGLTPEQYRAKWGLPRDYPMVAPAYATQRSDLAKSLGLGRRAA